VIGRIVTRFAAGLRFPTLFKLVAALFVVDLLVPDVIPFMDEILLASGTLLLGSLRRRRAAPLEPGAAVAGLGRGSDDGAGRRAGEPARGRL
jgi:hypothetical protein